MKQTLSFISDYSLDHAVHGINSVLQDLREGLGDDRFKNELFCRLLEIASVIDGEYINRQKKQEDTRC